MVYPLKEILLLCLLAVLAGAVARFADHEHAGDILNIHKWANRYPARPIRLGTKQFPNR